ncbi:unnamed protein product [Closterium sp. NIES-64]|nr:unnamed protein product [Closterium sp. NIES-64]
MDLVSDGRREGGEDDLHAGSEPRPHPSSSGPWNLSRGQQREGGRLRDDADVVDLSDSASKADGKEEADEILMARDGKKDNVVEQERGEWSKDAGKDGSLVGMRGGCAKQRGSADTGLSADELRESSGEADRASGEVLGSGARRQGSSAEADRAPGDVRGSGARRRKSKENDCATGRMRGEDGPPEPQPETERRRRMEMGARRSPEPWDEEEDRRELRRRNALPWEVPEEEIRGKAEKEELRRRNDEQYRRRERSPQGKTGSEKEEYERGKLAGRKGPDAWERERLYQENLPEKKEGRWEESEKRREAYEAAGTEGKNENVGAWADEPEAAGTEGKNENVGAWADEPEVAGTEGKDEKVGAWAAAEGEERDEKVGARSCVLKAEKQVQRSRMAKQHVRKLREEHPQLPGEEMVKEAVRRAETGVRSMKVEMTCGWGQGDLRVGGWEGPMWDKAQEQEEVDSGSKEVGTWECRPAGEEVGHIQWELR